MPRIAAALALALLAPASPVGTAAAGGGLDPYVADYKVKYGSLTVGISRTELNRGRAAGQWTMETRITATGLGRLMASENLVQHSTFRFDESGLRPLSYRFEDGSRQSDGDVELQFDWLAGRVTGTAEGEAVDVAVENGLQDGASVQALVQLRLRGGAEPGLVAMIEKDKVKHYRFTLLRRERLKTDIGVLDTVVYRSTREGSSRENVYWYAPELGYVIVQAEQRRDGKRLFQTYISDYRPGS